MKKLILMLMLCAPMTMMAQKFGKVNTQQIMQSLPDVAKANGEMEALQKQLGFNQMQDELHVSGNVPDKDWFLYNTKLYIKKTFILNPAQPKMTEIMREMIRRS